MPDDTWYYAKNNQQLGPVTIDALRNMLATGQVGAGDLVWTQGMANWVPAETVPELAGAASQARSPQPQPHAGAPGMPGAQGGEGQSYLPPNVPPPAYTPPGYYGGPQMSTDQSSRATTAMWLGIASLPMCLCPLIGLGLGIAAIIVGNGVHEGPDKGKARTGVICGIIGLVFGLINAIAGVYLQFNKGGAGW